MTADELKKYLEEKKKLIEAELGKLLPPEEGPCGLLARAMRYSVLAPGKRIRPILCLAACRAAGGDERNALRTACALEFIHTYSLIHDDLPSMDNDDLRRGRPTSHKVFGEGIAILAGDALFTLALEVVEEDDLLSDQQCRRISGELARAAGWDGLVGGQVLDLISENKIISARELEGIHRRKTGALLTAAVRCGGLAGDADTRKLEALTAYGKKIGLAFQIKDDLLDLKGEKADLGKTPGKDEKLHKATYPALLGVEKSRGLLARLLQEAQTALTAFGNEADPLRAIARFIGTRKK